MKQLIIGIDGGTREIFERMPMPFLHGKMKEYHGPELEIDLVSRGWAEQLSGKYAADTKAFYVYPRLDGSHQVTLKFSLDDLLNADVTPIWDLALNSKASVGFMNIPTTFPAPQVNGFFVSGAGGGVNKVDGIPDALCYPQSDIPLLKDENYVIDLRVGTAGIQDVGELFDRCVDMMEARTKAYIKMSQKHRPELGFLAYRFVTIIQYLGMSEINAFFAEREGRDYKFKPSEVWASRLEDLYSKFDDCLREIVESLQPEHLIFSSDHGIAAKEKLFNPNAFLRQIGMQKVKINIGPSIRRMGGALRRLQTPTLHKEVDWDNTMAFTDWYTSCIFVNDTKRFNGPVSEGKVNQVIDMICEKFNAFPEAIENGLHAEPYRRLCEGKPFYDLCPDIKICHGDGSFMAGQHEPFIRDNPDYLPVSNMKSVHGGMHSGNKTMYPFFLTDPETAKLIRDEDPKDLTLVYKLTERIFS